jgi:hypothetical protein
VEWRILLHRARVDYTFETEIWFLIFSNRSWNFWIYEEFSATIGIPFE